MAVSVKSHREIELMREAGKILGTVLNNLTKEIKPGMSTWHIDKMLPSPPYLERISPLLPLFSISLK